MAQFKKGDTVFHKSGGPKMIVTRVEDDGTVICEWFVNGDLKTHGFDEATLKPPGLARSVALVSTRTRR